MGSETWSRASAAAVIGVLLTVTAAKAGAQSRWGFGTDAGFMAGTVDGSAFAIRFSADFYAAPAFSVSPTVLFTPAGDLREIVVAGLFRYHIRPPGRGLEVAPFSGVGFVDAKLDVGTTEGERHVDDSSLYFPLGLSVAARASPDIDVFGTLLVGLHDLDFRGAVNEEDRGSFALLVGVQYRPF